MFAVVFLMLFLLFLLYVVASNPVLLIACIALAIATGIQMHFDSQKKEKEQAAKAREEKRNHDNAQAIDFYKACTKRGAQSPAVSLSFDALAWLLSASSSDYSGDEQLSKSIEDCTCSEEDKQLIALVAKSTNVSQSPKKALEIFRHGCYLTEVERRQSLVREVEAERSAEQSLIEKQKELSGLVGKEKYLHGLKVELAKAKENKESWERVNGQLLRSAAGSANTTDWASAGGFASAIAGPAAGLAVASDIQSRNAQAEADKNWERANYVSASAFSRMMTQKADTFIEFGEKVIRQIGQLVLDDSDKEGKMHLIEVEVLSQEATKFGNLSVRMTAHWKQQPNLFGQPAALDGSLLIEAYRGGDVIGRGYYNAPGFDEFVMDNVGFRPNHKDGHEVLLLSPLSDTRFESGKAYKITISPVHLWIIEAPKDKEDKGTSQTNAS